MDARIINSSTGFYMLNLLENLQDVDKSNKYTVLVYPKDLEYWKPRSKRFNIVASPHQLSSFAEQTRLFKQIHLLKPDLVHFTMPQQPAILGIKRVTTIHDLTPLNFKTPRSTRSKRAIYRLLLQQVARRSDGVIVPSEYVKEELAKFAAINSRKIRVIYDSANPITDPVEPIEELESKRFILFIGRPAPHKNLNRLVDAFKIASHAEPDLHLVFAGKTSFGHRKLQFYSKRNEVDNIVFTDHVSEGQKRWLYENAATYAFPSLSEGFGLPGLEAMAHGCPVVSSNATCLPEIYGDGALYFDPEDAEEMASKLLEVVQNDKTRSKLIAKGAVQLKKYSWKRTAEQTLDVYNEVLGLS